MSGQSAGDVRDELATSATTWASEDLRLTIPAECGDGQTVPWRTMNLSQSSFDSCLLRYRTLLTQQCRSRRRRA